MTEISARVTAVVQHFEAVEQTRMRDMPILNSALRVEAVAPRPFGDHYLCVLIAPWFMNLVLLPGTDKWDADKAGSFFSIEMPRESMSFCLSRDDQVGTYLTAVMFRTMSGFPDQRMARDVANEVMRELFAEGATAERGGDGTGQGMVSRRSLLTGQGVG